MTVLRPVSSILAQARRPTHIKLLPGLLLLQLGIAPTAGPSATSFSCQARNIKMGSTMPTEVAAGEESDNKPLEQQQQPEDYDKWDKESLVKRVKQLEDELKRGAASSKALQPAVTKPVPVPDIKGLKTRRERKAAASKKTYDPSKHATRMIALKLAYLGKNYNGFEYSKLTKVTTIEEELWKALVKSCLISPENPDVVDFAPFEYSKCGRTDKGVSAFGQVINLRVRSQRKVRKPEMAKQIEGGGEAVQQQQQQQQGDVEMKDVGDAAQSGLEEKEPGWDPIVDEIQYCKVLNRLLPPDIRVLAWAPNPPPNFSSRFSCRERQYRYYFTQPAFTPMPSSIARPGLNNGWLDIDAMRKAAKLFEGVHDFRNFAKIDPSKQITEYTRRIYESDIVEVKDVGSALPYLQSVGSAPPSSTGLEKDEPIPKVYYFHVRGSAFLWHQIRHMVGILFLVGQGLESPSIVSELLDVAANPRRPSYLMADEVPLVLWDCIFPKLDDAASGAAPRDREENMHDPDVHVDVNMKDDGIDWLWMGEDSPYNLHSTTGTVNQMWELWRGRKMDELLAGQLLNRIATQADISKCITENVRPEKQRGADAQKIFRGADGGELFGPYFPVMKKPVIASPQEQNDKWAQSKGFVDAEDLKKTPMWRSAIRANKRKAEEIAADAPGDGVASS